MITPSPPDYFLQCANTSLCRSLCGPEWQAFQAADTNASAMPTIQITTESLFFPGVYDHALSLSNATAITEVDGNGTCTTRVNNQPQDFAVAVAQLDAYALSVAIYCIPQVLVKKGIQHVVAFNLRLSQAPGIGVYLATTGNYGPFTLPGDLMSAAFVDAQHLALLARVGSTDILLIANRLGLLQLPPLDPLIPSSQTLLRITGIWPVLGNIVVNALVRSFQGNALVGDVLNFRYQITGNGSRWYPCTADLSPFSGQYWFTGVTDPSVTLFFLLPKAQGQPVYSVTFQYIASDLQILDLAPLDELNRFPFQV